MTHNFLTLKLTYEIQDESDTEHCGGVKSEFVCYSSKLWNYGLAVVVTNGVF